MSLAPGTKLGPYEILAPLGAGGMGEVYSARDRRLERSVAIKILPEHLSSDPTQKQRFEREAKAISSLTHPNICTLYDVGYQNAVDFLVMELLDGESLASRLEKGAMPLAQVLKTGREVSDALDKAHRSGVVHRVDIENTFPFSRWKVYSILLWPTALHLGRRGRGAPPGSSYTAARRGPRLEL